MPRLSTGSIALDVALTLGGWPRGQLVEIFGDTTTGKSTLGLLAAASAQRAGEEAAIIDTDQTLDAGYAKALGVDLSRLLVCQPESGETAVGVATKLLAAGAVGLVVLDSIAALVPEEELALSTGAAPTSSQRRLVDAAARDLLNIAHRRRATVICINRPVMQPGRDGGFVERTAGGSLLPSLAAVRIRLSRVGGGARLTRVRAVIEKNAGAPSSTGRAVDILLGWGSGIEPGADLLVAAYDLHLLAVRGGAFWFRGSRLGNAAEARAALSIAGAWRSAVLAAVEEAAPWRRDTLPQLPDDAALTA